MMKIDFAFAHYVRTYCIEEREFAEHTINRHKNWIKRFIKYNRHIKYMQDITKSELLSWKEDMKQKYASSTIQWYVDWVRSFIKWARTIESWIIHESNIGVAKLKKDWLKKHFITKEEFKEIYLSCWTWEYWLRAKLIFLMMYNCWLRTSELIRIEVNDFLDEETWKLCPVFITKISKWRTRDQCVAPKTFNVLKQYLKKRSIESKFLFPNYNKPHTHMSQAILYKIIKKVRDKAGIKKRMNPYTFRRTSITNDAIAWKKLDHIAIDKWNSPKTILKHYLLNNKEWAKYRGSFTDLDFL